MSLSIIKQKFSALKHILRLHTKRVPPHLLLCLGTQLSTRSEIQLQSPPGIGGGGVELICLLARRKWGGFYFALKNVCVEEVRAAKYCM